MGHLITRPYRRILAWTGNHAGKACIVLCIVYLAAGLWPFNVRQANNVTWPESGGGIAFGRYGIAYSDRTFDLASIAVPTSAAGSVTIELYLQPRQERSGDSGAILSISDRKMPPNLLISQSGQWFVMRLPSLDPAGGRLLQEAAIKGIMRLGLRRVIAVTSSEAGTQLYVDGVSVRKYPKLVPVELLRGRVVLGAGPTGNSSWRGTMFGAAIFRRALTPPEVLSHYEVWRGNRAREFTSDPALAALYLFDEGNGRIIHDRSESGCTLFIPERYRGLYRTVLIPPWREWHRVVTDIKDVVVNIVAFVPFGFFYYSYRRQTPAIRPLRNLVWTVTVSFLISLAIEITQVTIPIRYSSLTDLLCNTGGSLFGGLAAAYMHHGSVRSRETTGDCWRS
jgi:hypothetical protein